MPPDQTWQPRREQLHDVRGRRAHAGVQRGHGAEDVRGGGREERRERGVGQAREDARVDESGELLAHVAVFIANARKAALHDEPGVRRELRGVATQQLRETCGGCAAARSLGASTSVTDSLRVPSSR